MKKSPEKSKNVLEEKRRNGRATNLNKKDKQFTVIAKNFVQEQFKKSRLKVVVRSYVLSKNLDDERKKTARQALTYNLQNFH